MSLVQSRTANGVRFYRPVRKAGGRTRIMFRSAVSMVRTPRLTALIIRKLSSLLVLCAIDEDWDDLLSGKTLTTELRIWSCSAAKTTPRLSGYRRQECMRLEDLGIPVKSRFNSSALRDDAQLTDSLPSSVHSLKCTLRMFNPPNDCS
jgi:hypothetical protein